MKLFLLKEYAKSSFEATESRGILLLLLAAPVAVTNALVMPEFALWLTTILALLGVLATPQRATSFEAALPIRGSDIAIARLLITLGTSLTILLLVAVIIVVRHEVAFPVMQAVHSAAIIVLGVLLPRLVKPKVFAIKPIATIPPLVVLAAAVLASTRYLSDVVTSIWLGLAIVVAAYAWWRAVPESYQAAPVTASSSSPRDSNEVSSSGAAWWRMLTMSLFTGNRIFFGIFLVLASAMGQWWLYAMMMLSVDDIRQRTRWMQSLPISHRRRLWLVLGPSIVLPVGLILLGTHLHVPGRHFRQNLRTGAPGTYKQEAGYFDSPTSVSIEYWNRAVNDTVPIVTAPWGETVKPYQIRVLNATFYNPYSSRPMSSKDFTDWQFKRLTTAVYGFPVAREDYDSRAIQPRRMTESPRMMVLNVVIGVVLMMAYLFIMSIAKMHIWWSRSTEVVIGSSVTVLLPMLLVFYMSINALRQDTTDIVIPFFEWHLLRFSAVLPSNFLAVALLAALPLLAMYALLEWQFKRSEIVGAMLKADS